MPKRDDWQVYASRLGVGVALLLVWQLVGLSSARGFFLVGTPVAVLRELSGLWQSDEIAKHFLVTGAEALFGLILGTLLGSAFGLGLWYSDKVARVAHPFVVGMGAMPIFAFAPLLIVWFGVGFWMKVALATLSTVFIAFSHAHRGAQAVMKKYVDSLRAMQASPHDIFIKVIVPGSMERVLETFRMSIGLSLLGAFIGEFIASDRGLGHLLLKASSLYDVPRALAVGVWVVALALLFDRIGEAIERRRLELVQLLLVPQK